jgi:hypothetical protein
MEQEIEEQKKVETEVETQDSTIDGGEVLNAKLLYAKRDLSGLLNNVEYKLNEEGFIDWRAMIKPAYLYINKDSFASRNLQVPESKEGLADNELLITLSGIKEIARLRGYTSVRFEVSHVNESHVVAKCQIKWSPNFETNYEEVFYEDVANATIDNTDDFCVKFLETIACNRAFIRCVRNFLNIHIVGFDEIDKSKNKKSKSEQLSNALPLTPQGTLEKIANEKLEIKNFTDYKVYLRDLWVKASENKDDKILEILRDAAEWNSFKDISARASRVLIKVATDG